MDRRSSPVWRRRAAAERSRQQARRPNRIRDGRYTWEGKELQLPITEVARGHASHGLVRWAVWELIEHESESVTVGYRLYPQPGWEHPLDLRTTYVLDDSGLVVTTAARNVGPTAAPFGYGAHPYLAIGSTPLAEVQVQVPASTWSRSTTAWCRPGDWTSRAAALTSVSAGGSARRGWTPPSRTSSATTTGCGIARS